MTTFIKKERESRNMEQKDLAAKIGVAPGTLGNYEAGRREPPLDVLCAIADLFDISLDLLIRGKEKDHPEGWSKKQIVKELERMDFRTLSDMLMISAILTARKEAEELPDQETADVQ